MKMIPCYCNKEVEFDFPEEIDIAESPDTVDSIFDGSFMSVTCPYCGKVLKPEEPVRIFDSKGTLDINLVPELRRNAFLSGRHRVASGTVAIGFPELAEKLAIYLAGLDEGTVEILKLPGINRDSGSDIAIYFAGLETDSLVFHVHGLQPDKIGVTRISRDLYERTREALEKTDDPVYKEIKAPPYVSVRKIYREGIS